ncbi:hypothetical protein OG948_39815 (plasmid) [Embleya sp. NBC_00888]|nr:hypothetical protein OG948_39815 [Embleya sp. NBC_00888]
MAEHRPRRMANDSVTAYRKNSTDWSVDARARRAGPGEDAESA